MAESKDERDIGEGDLNKKDLSYRLTLVLRKQHAHSKFAQAVNDLEHLDLARNFPKSVPDNAEICKRFKAFIESLPENEEALKDADELLKHVAEAVAKITAEEGKK